MASTTDLYRKRQGASLTTCSPPQQTCSTCGALECTCRPRFFAGQVLNADDLNRLDAYIRAKHRLHNRQLHGWGVVNGLEVMCNPCGDGVTVGCGYALSQCGDDIVVCEAVHVPVCDLIRKCLDAEAKGMCAPFQHPNATACAAAGGEWVLAIRYSEKPQRGVQPLYATATKYECGCSSCGAKTGCSCGNGGSATKKKAGSCGCKGQCSCVPAAKPRGAPVQCEPTVICEGFEFEVYRREKPKTDDDDDDDDDVLSPGSPLIARFMCCFENLVTNAPQAPGPFTPAAVAANPNAWFLWACRFQAHLIRHFQNSSGYNCELLARLTQLVIAQPGPNNQNVPQLIQAIELMMLVVIDALLACLCSALLPPCPMPTNEGRVPLAVLHVGGNPCRVQRICNWALERKFATTFPALQYWLSILPCGRNLRAALQAICCFDLNALFPTDPAVPGTAAMVAPPAAPFGVAPNNIVQPGVAQPDAAGAAGAPAPTSSIFRQQALLRLNPSVADPTRLQNAARLLTGTLTNRTPLEPETLINTLLAKSPGDAKLTDVEASNLPQFLLLNNIAKPIAQAVSGPTVDTVLTMLLRGAAAEPEPAGEPQSVAEMRAQIAELKSAVEEQSAQIAELRAGGGGTTPRPRRGGNR